MPHRLLMGALLERYHDKVAGVMSCWDRVIIQGTLPGLSYAAGMTSYLNAHDIRIFDYPRFAQPLRDEVRANAEKLAAETGIEIEFMRKSSYRKEARIKEVLKQRGSSWPRPHPVKRLRLAALTPKKPLFWLARAR